MESPLHDLKPGDRVRCINDDGCFWHGSGCRGKREMKDRVHRIDRGVTYTVASLLGRYLIFLDGKTAMFGYKRFEKVRP